MTERNDDPHVTDPFLARIALPSMEARDPEAMAPMIWPIAPPRVRKILMEQIEDLADHHFVTKVFAAILAGAVFLSGGLAIYLLLRQFLPFEFQPYVFAGAFTMLFIGLSLLADRYRPPEPMEVYYASHGGNSPRGKMDYSTLGRLARVALFGPYLVTLAFRKLLEPPPPTDEETLDVALRLLPALHRPLPLYQAELAGIATREQLRRAALQLIALNLADLMLSPSNDVLLTPRTACTQLLRKAAVAVVSPDSDTPWLEMEPDLVRTAEIDTMELLAQGEKLGLEGVDTTTSEWPPGEDDPGEDDPGKGDP